jgi:intein/homing endonuclease
MWMKKAVLGLDASENKKNVAIKADWILNMPQDWKVAFIQGLADGDGYASIPRFDTGIATITNQEFFAELLASVGIESTTGDERTRIKKHDEILKARELPLFRFATGRQQILVDMCNIIKLKPKRRHRIPEEEKKLVMELYRSGLKPGKIVEILWHEHGLARTTDMIYTLIRREHKNK